MSPSDRLDVVRVKMRKYQENGVKLGWLISPQQQVEIYNSDKSPDIIDRPDSLSGRTILPGLVIELDFIWQ